MPDGNLKIELDGPLAAEVRAAAEACDLTPDAWAAQALAAWLLSWEEDFRRLEEPGENIPLDVAFDELNARVAALRTPAK
jgi:hypothetical protein